MRDAARLFVFSSIVWMGGESVEREQYEIGATQGVVAFIAAALMKESK